MFLKVKKPQKTIIVLGTEFPNVAFSCFYNFCFYYKVHLCIYNLYLSTYNL